MMVEHLADSASTEAESLDLSKFPLDTLFHERRSGGDRRTRGDAPGPAGERRVRKERRRRVDPTTFEKQYTPDELEFMNAMQRFKVQSGKAFPSHREVLEVAYRLGYRQVPASERSNLGESAPELP